MFSKLYSYLKNLPRRYIWIAAVIGVGVLSVILWSLYGSVYLVEEEKKKNDDEEQAEEKTEYIIQRIYTICEDHEIKKVDELPDELEQEVLKEGEKSIKEGALPDGWHLTYEQKRNHEGIQRYQLTMVEKLCSECAEKRYLGIHEGKIAIFKGEPSHGILHDDLDGKFEVKEVFRERFEEGIKFEDEEEMKKILENYTS